jgi:methylated-DNA-[protein]-cysteine S-methyltransferase
MTDIESALKGAAKEVDIADAAAAGTQRFGARAAEEGLLDVAYTTVDSPVGELLLASTPRGLVRLVWTEHGLDGLLGDLSTKVSPRMLEAPARLDDVRRELDEYFEGKRTDFETPVDMALSHGFYLKALRAIARIPYGEVASYKQVATRAGNERAVRAAGSAAGSNPVAIVVPCHRVLRTGGGLGGYGGGLERKEFLLKLEGVLL